MTPLNRDERQMYRVVMPEKGPDRQQFLSHQTRGSGRCHSHVPAGPQTVSPQQVNTRRTLSLLHKAQPRCGYSHQPTEGRNSSAGLAHTSNRSYSQQPAGSQDYSCRQTQPRSRSYSHHQAEYRNEKRVSSQASKMYILRQKSTKLNEMRSESQTEECNNRRESDPSPVQEGSEHRRRRIGVCYETDETKEHRMFVRVLRKRF